MATRLTAWLAGLRGAARESRRLEVDTSGTPPDHGAIFKAALDPMVISDGGGLIVDANPAACRLVDTNHGGLVGRRLHDFVDPGRVPDRDRLRSKALRAGSKQGELELSLPGGAVRTVELGTARLGPRRHLLVLRDVTERRLTENALRASEQRYRRIFENANEGIGVVDADGRIVAANPKLQEMVGYSEEEQVGRPIFDFMEPDAQTVAQAELASGKHAPSRHQNRLRHKDGHGVWVEVSSAALTDEGGNYAGQLALISDISERKQAEQRLSHLAYHDELTGLPNRALFEQHLEPTLAAARRHGRSVGVLEINLSGFKLVNDSLGYGTGDEVLRQVAERLRAVVRAQDMVARSSGDAFLVLLAELEGGDASRRGGRPAAQEWAAAAGRLHETLRRPFRIPKEGVSNEFSLDASIGVSLFPADADDGEALLRHADAALHEGKRSYPSGTRLYSGSQDDPSVQLGLRSRLRRAVDDGEFVLHYQPLVDLGPAWQVASAVDIDLGKHMVGVEALIRWKDPEHGLVSPAGFIPVAEEIGLIEPISEWVVLEAADQARRWHEHGFDPLIALNISPRLFRERRALRHLLEAIGASGADPRRLILEITESAAMEDPTLTRELMSEVREWGLRPAIDDFGAGYSALGRLLDIRPDFLKVDRSMIRDVPHSTQAATLAANVIRLGRELGTQVVQEGIETEDQWRFATEQGCPLGQGFLFARPMPAVEIESLLALQAPVGP